MSSDSDIIQGFYCEMPEGVIQVSRQPLALALKCRPLKLAGPQDEIVAYSYNATAETDINLNFRYLSLEAPWHPWHVCWGLAFK